ncbi:DUF1697 domain-containing protein [Rhodobacterales bacterium]|nr:DUF1697 domain-containing protein [Rhodobacterales bacterium]
MNVLVALLRAVNVGGTGKLRMAELRAIAGGIGFENVATYIQSGNLVFTTDMTREKAQSALEAALTSFLGQPQSVLLRTAGELEALCAAAPFPEAAPNKVLITFLPDAPPADALGAMVAPSGEEAVLLEREIVVHYPEGQGRSKLKLPALAPGTARNLNTVRKLLEMAQELS